MINARRKVERINRTPVKPVDKVGVEALVEHVAHLLVLPCSLVVVKLFLRLFVVHLLHLLFRQLLLARFPLKLKVDLTKRYGFQCTVALWERTLSEK